MRSVHIDSTVSDEERRQRLYDGDLFVHGASQATLALAALAKAMLEEAFHPLEPETAQFSMAVEDYAGVLAELKPAFIHHPECKVLIPRILADFGCDPEDTYFDIPRLRSSTARGYLTTGIAYAFHPHRDTWYSAAPCQINWWLPVYPLSTEMGMAFHPGYFDSPVPNNSEVYDYYRWNQESRGSAAKHIGKDTRVQPKPQGPIDHSGDFELVTPVGGVTLFSGAQLHSSITNNRDRTRFSIDFRTVSATDVEHGRGAPNVDSRCTGTSLRDFLRVSDLSRLPKHFCEQYDEIAPALDAQLIYDTRDQASGCDVEDKP